MNKASDYDQSGATSDIYVLHQQGQSIHRIARDLGISIKTVRTYLRDRSKEPMYPEQLSRLIKLQPCQDYLRTRIEADLSKPHIKE